MAVAIMRLLKDKHRRQEIGKKAKMYVENTHSVETVINRIEKSFRQMCDKA